MNIDDTVRKIKLYLFDLDGTLYIGEKLFDFTIPLLKNIRERGSDYLFMTNNSSKSVKDYVKKLGKLGISADTEDFVTSSQATSSYLRKNHPDKVLYVCGTRSLKEELKKGGAKISEEPEEAECVVMGFDTELSFKKLRDVSWLLLTKPDIPYIATNPDYVCPTEFGSVPDCGSVCDMLYNVSHRRPVVIGKPEPAMPLAAMEKWGVGPDRTAVIGDRIYTDIKSGIAAGCVTILVMSGETDRATLDASPDKPDFVLDDCGALLDILKNS